jgi:hypothetical protein
MAQLKIMPDLENITKGPSVIEIVISKSSKWLISGASADNRRIEYRRSW